MSTDEFEIIDVHVHLFRSLRHEKAAFTLPGKRDRDRWATPEAIVPFMDRTGISKAVFLNLFPTNELREAALKKLPATLTERERAKAELDLNTDLAVRIQRHNEWACEVAKQNPGLVPFIGVQKVMGPKGMAEEVALRLKHGAKGVKIHPGMYFFYPNDRDMWPLYEACQELGVPVLSDSGPFHGAPLGINFGEPVRFVEVLKDFPRLTLILAHLGSAFWDERIEIARQFPNVCFDTSQGFSTPEAVSYHEGRGLSVSDAVRVIRKIGVNRIMFGSDGPALDWAPQLEELLRLNLTEEEQQAILAGNAHRILKI
jgi:hypothetical protein